MNWIDLEQLLLTPAPQRQVSTTLNHADLCQRALAFAAWLQQQNVRRVALHLDNAEDLAIALLGAWQAAARVLLPADDRPRTREHLADQVDLWLDQLTSEMSAEPLAARELQADEVLLTLCTSGSTGQPKLIDKHLYQMSEEARGLENTWGKELGWACMLGSVSTQHIYGLLFRLLWPLCSGRLLTAHASPFPEDLQRQSLMHDEFVWVTSPALLKRLGENLDWAALGKVKKIFSSGGPLPADAAQTVKARLQQWPTEIYGSSETGGIAWRQGDAPWQPFPGVRLELGESSVLKINSPYLPKGHIEYSADAAKMESDGRFRLLGRLDRIIKLEEKRISLPMLEQALCTHPWVSDCRLGAIQQNRAFLGALIALAPQGIHALRNQGRRHITQTLRQHLGTYCEALALPRRWSFLAELPYTTQGKLPQHQVEQLLAAPRTKHAELLSCEQLEEEWLVHLSVPLDLAYFSGHFPGSPVLPGVVQIEWAQQIARQLMPELPPRFTGMEVLKFQQLVRPGDRLILKLRFDSARSKLYFTFGNGQANSSSGRICLEPIHA